MTPSLVVETRGPGQTRRAARALGALLGEGDVIALSGDLGAGKTCFVQGLARGLGVRAGERVPSPTFNIVLSHPGRVTLHHVDLYRLGGEDELAEIGLDRAIGAEGVYAVEWMERFPGLAPPERIDVSLTIVSASVRRIEAVGHGERGRAVVASWRAVL